VSGPILAIDLGTGGPKAALVDERGAVLVWAHAPVTTSHVPGGGAEQDPEEIWRAVRDAVHEVSRRAPIGSGPPSAVAVTSQFMSSVPVDDTGSPVGPCILWMDTRGGPLNAGLLNERTFPMWIDRHGLIPLPSGNDGLGHVLWLREHRPEVHDRARAFVEPVDYLTARMTGRVTATQSTAFGLLTVDNRTWGSVAHDPELVTAAGIDPQRLPELVPMDAVVGPMRRAVADELGLPVGVPVCAGTIDSITSAIGTGALTPADGAVVIGTTSVFVSHVTEKRGEIDRGILSVPSPVPGRYFVMAENGVGGRAVEWFLREVLAASGDHDALTRLALSVPPGADGVSFCPWMLGSIAPAPDDDVRGAFVGFGLTHGRAHLGRAVLEGIAANLGWLRPHVENFVGGPFEFVRFGGGLAQSDLVADLLADALERPVHRIDEPRATNARGAALLALHQLGRVHIDETPSLLPVRSVHTPDPERIGIARALVSRLELLHPVLARMPA
jgi:xylulokinase